MTAWPRIILSFETFSRQMQELAVASTDLAAQAADLVLACACAAGDPEAIRLFDARFMTQIGTYVGRLHLPPHLLDEVRQLVRMKQLLGASPGIGRYRGRGPLGAWVRVTAVRVALDVAGENAPAEVGLDIPIIELWDSLRDNPEVETVKNLYRGRLMAALEESLTALSTRDRTLLRLHIVDGLGIDAIGRIYRVHRATVARWLVAIRGRIFRQLRETLGVTLGTSSSELRSLVRILQSEIHLSARRVLTSHAG